MRLFWTGLTTLFAAALAAQLAAPVLAANAKTLNLFCPAHSSAADKSASHETSAHAAHDMPAAHSSVAHGHDHAPAPVPQDQPQQERNLFDLSCCSVHLAGVMPVPSASFAGLSGALQGIAADDSAAASPGMADPPPRIAV